jgi:hypothetical protein
MRERELQASGVLAGETVLTMAQFTVSGQVYDTFPAFAKHREEDAEKAGDSAAAIQEVLEEDRRKTREDAQHPQRTDPPDGAPPPPSR